MTRQKSIAALTAAAALLCAAHSASATESRALMIWYNSTSPNEVTAPAGTPIDLYFASFGITGVTASIPALGMAPISVPVNTPPTQPARMPGLGQLERRRMQLAALEPGSYDIQIDAQGSRRIVKLKIGQPEN